MLRASNATDHRSNRPLALYANLANTVDPPPLPAPVSRDPDNDALLALGAAVQAEMIVSGDRDLIVLGIFAGIPIVTPAEAVARLGA